MSDVVNERIVVLLGPEGKGKSATGNTLLGRKEFKLQDATSKVSSKGNIEQATCSTIISHHNVELTIVDTPGLFQSRNVAKTALKLLQVTDLKPHVFVLVLRSDHFTDDEKYTADMMTIVFGRHIFEHTMLVLTHSDKFVRDQHLNALINRYDFVSELLELCENRVMLIDNAKKVFDFDDFRQISERLATRGRMMYDLDYMDTVKVVCNELIYKCNTFSNKSIKTQLQEIGQVLGWPIPLSQSVVDTRQSGLQSVSLCSNEYFNEKTECKIVLIGKTGNGKSATGNTLLGWNNFKTGDGAKVETRNITSARCDRIVNNSHRVIEIFDTPGLFECGKVLETALKLVDVVDKKPHVFVLVMKKGRITEEDKLTVDMLRIIFGEHVFRHTLIVITHADFATEEEFDGFLRESELFTNLEELCGKRILKIDNNTRHFHTVKFFSFADKITENETLVYEHKDVKERKSVLKKYLQQKNIDTSLNVQLQEIRAELGRRLHNRKMPLIAGTCAGVAISFVGFAIWVSVTDNAGVVARCVAIRFFLRTAATYAMQGAATIWCGVLSCGRTIRKLDLMKFW